MKKLLAVLVFVSLLSGMFAFSNTKPLMASKYDWIPLNSGLPSLNHSALGISPVDPKVMYAGTYIGVFVSTDGGETWWERVISPEEENKVQVKCIALSLTDARTAYVGTYRKGIYVTNDAGLSWTPINSGLTSKDIETVAIDPKNPNIIYAGTYGAGIFKSTNGGKSFVLKSTGLSEKRVKKLAIDPQDSNLIYAVLYGNAGIFKSEDGGNTWKDINNGLTGGSKDIGSFAIDPVENNILYAGTQSIGKLYISNDFGKVWKESKGKLPETWINDIVIDYKNNKVIYLATGQGIYKTEDGGLTFRKKDTGITDSNIRAIVIHPFENLVLYTSTFSAGVLKTSDGGNTWVSRSTGLPFYSVICNAINPDTSELFIGTEKGIYSSKDFGKNFVSKGLQDFAIECIAIDPGDYKYMYVGTYYKGLYISEDAGNTWRKGGQGLENESIFDVEVDPADYRVVYAATYEDGIYKSKDMGQTWKNINVGLKDKDVYAVEVDPKNSKILYAGTAGGGVFKSTNAGESWNAINKGLTNYDVAVLRINQNDPKVLYAGTYGGGVFKSTDSGDSWVEFNKGLENKIVWDIRLNPAYPNTLAVATNGGVFFVENFGTTWEKMNPGLTDLRVITVAFEPNDISFIYAGTYEGGFFRKQITRVIAASAGEGGIIKPSGSVEVPFGEEVTFTMTPEKGYKVKELYLGSKKYNPYTSFKITKVAVNTTFRAVFEKEVEEKKQIIITLQIGNRNFTVDGITKELDSPPIIKNGRTLLPIRAIIESLGGTIGWEGTERKVTISLENTNIELWIGKSTARVNGVEKPIDSSNASVVPEIISGRTMLPVRFVTENLGAKVDWDGETKTVTITYPAP